MGFRGHRRQQGACEEGGRAPLSSSAEELLSFLVKKGKIYDTREEKMISVGAY